MPNDASDTSKLNFCTYVITDNDSERPNGSVQDSSQSLMNSIRSLFDQNRPRFSFREERERSPVVGKVSPVKNARVLFQLLDSDAADAMFASWLLNRYQRIMPRRLTRLSVKEHKILTRHAKRLRQLLIMTNQSKALNVVKPRRRRPSRAVQAKRRKSTQRKILSNL